MDDPGSIVSGRYAGIGNDRSRFILHGSLQAGAVLCSSGRGQQGEEGSQQHEDEQHASSAHSSLRDRSKI